MKRRKNLAKSMSVFFADSVSGRPKLVMLSQDYHKRTVKNKLPQVTLAKSLSLTDCILSATTAEQKLLLETAAKQLGKQYHLSASVPKDFDNSGLIKYIFAEALRMDLPQEMNQLKKYGRTIPLTSLQPGDLLFYDTKDLNLQVGIYIGKQLMIHAQPENQVVTAESLENFQPKFANRLLDNLEDNFE